MAEMKLLRLFAAFDQGVIVATRQTSYTEFLDASLQAEDRLSTRTQTGYRIEATKFTLRPAFADIDFTANHSISKVEIEKHFGMQWLVDGRPVLQIGQTGVGKTFLARATRELHACACGKSLMHMTVTTSTCQSSVPRGLHRDLGPVSPLRRPILAEVPQFFFENHGELVSSTMPPIAFDNGFRRNYHSFHGNYR
jgi:hypothetical protein